MTENSPAPRKLAQLLLKHYRMNANLLIVDSTSISNLGIAADSSKPVAEEKTNLDGTSECASTEPADKSQQDFDHTLRKKIMEEEPAVPQQGGTEPRQQQLNPDETAQPTSENPALLLDFLTVTTTVVKTAPAVQNPNEPALSLDISEGYKNSAGLNQVVEIGKNEQKAQLLNENSVETKDLKNQKIDNVVLPTGEKPIPANITKTAVANSTTAATGNTKTTVPDNNLAAIEEKSQDSNLKIQISTEKSALSALKTTSQRTDDSRQTHLSSQSFTADTKQQTAQPLGDFVLKNSNPSQQLQASVGQAKTTDTPSADNPDSNVGQILAGSQTSTTENLTASSAAAKTAGSITLPAGTSADTSISEQIKEYINSSLRPGDQQLTIHLNPPELGKVSIKFKEQGEQIVGLLEVSRTQTKYEIEQVLPQIVRTLQDAGVQIKRVEVVLTDQPEQQMLKEQSSANSWTERHSFTDSGSMQRNTSETAQSDERTANSSSYTSFTEPQRTHITDKSINMLV